jgi:hypothetical protein
VRARSRKKQVRKTVYRVQNTYAFQFRAEEGRVPGNQSNMD